HRALRSSYLSHPDRLLYLNADFPPLLKAPRLLPLPALMKQSSTYLPALRKMHSMYFPLPPELHSSCAALLPEPPRPHLQPLPLSCLLLPPAPPLRPPRSLLSHPGSLSFPLLRGSPRAPALPALLQILYLLPEPLPALPAPRLLPVLPAVSPPAVLLRPQETSIPYSLLCARLPLYYAQLPACLPLSDAPSRCP